MTSRKNAARLFQHELDHLEGRLLLELLDADQRKSALRALRDRELGVSTSETTGRRHRSGAL